MGWRPNTSWNNSLKSFTSTRPCLEVSSSRKRSRSCRMRWGEKKCAPPPTDRVDAIIAQFRERRQQSQPPSLPQPVRGGYHHTDRRQRQCPEPVAPSGSRNAPRPRNGCALALMEDPRRRKLFAAGSVFGMKMRLSKRCIIGKTVHTASTLSKHEHARVAT